MKHTLFILSLILLLPVAGHALVIRVPGDQPTIQAGIDAAGDYDTVLVAPGVYSGDGNRDIRFLGKAITVTSETGPDDTIVNGNYAVNHIGFIFDHEEGNASRLNGFTITQFLQYGDYGTGMQIESASPVISNCKIIYNSAWCGDGEHAGAGVYLGSSQAIFLSCWITQNMIECEDWYLFDAEVVAGVWAIGGDPSFFNCIISDNDAAAWDNPAGRAVGGIRCDTAHISNCSIVNNSGEASLSGTGGIQGSALIVNSIVHNYGTNIGGNPTIRYSNIGGGYEGDGNIDAIPLFTPGPLGEYYLSSTSAGQAQDSPCIDSGDSPAQDTCFPGVEPPSCLDSYTTRTDQITDLGMVDMGYHYLVVAIPTATPTPTATPSASPTASCGSLGVELWMPSHFFHPGDPCSCIVHVCNPGPQAMEHVPLFVVLDAFGQYYFAPGFTAFDHYLFESLMPGITEQVVVPPFSFPDNAGSVSGLIWYAGMTDAEFSFLVGAMDSWDFSWDESH